MFWGTVSQPLNLIRRLVEQIAHRHGIDGVDPSTQACDEVLHGRDCTGQRQ
jgi:hypothetical protein